MTIKYKFNKSSEARDCVVESVELHVKNNMRYEKTTFEEFKNDCDNLLKETSDITKEIGLNFNKDSFIEYMKQSHIFTTLDAGFATHTIYSRMYDDYSFTLHSTINNKTKAVKDVLEVERIKGKSLPIQFFTSQKELQPYINSIQEPIEFIAESDIDQVLMKEWIGEWETSYNCDECNNRNLGYWNDCDYNLCCKKEIKTGSPKLNSNWTFKIK